MLISRLAALLIRLAAGPAAFGEAAPFHAGLVRLPVGGEKPFDALVWYPTAGTEVLWKAGPFAIPASRDAAIAPGRFPIVLFSHGGGPGGGSPLILTDLSSDLARHGFVVVAPFHGGTGLRHRALQVTLVLDAVVADPRFAPHVDPERLAMLGFSLGTAVTLQLAGAVPNAGHLVSYCAAHPDDIMSCGHAPDGGNARAFPADRVSTPTLRSLKAIVLLDPYAVLFQPPELVAVTMPVLLPCPTRRGSRPFRAATLSSRTSAGRRCDRPHRRYAGIRRRSIAQPSTRGSRAKSSGFSGNGFSPTLPALLSR